LFKTAMMMAVGSQFTTFSNQFRLFINVKPDRR